MEREAVQKMNKLDHALSLAQRGFHVFPLAENSKVPLKGMKFNELATNDSKKIIQMWTDPFTEEVKNFNIGVSTTTSVFGPLLVLDIDNKDDKEGSKNLANLGLIPEASFSVLTPTLGYHVYYLVDEPLSQGADVICHGVDTRAQGGYVAGPGSTIDGVPYSVMEDLPVVRASPEIITYCSKLIPKQERKQIDGINPDLAFKRAIEFLIGLPTALAGSRNDECYKTAAKIKDFGVGREDCLELMFNDWKCEPVLSQGEIEFVVGNVYKYGKLNPGTLAPEADFKPEPKPEKNKHYLETLNDNFALMFMGGDHAILQETIDEKGGKETRLLSEHSFKRMFSTKKNEGAKKTWAEEWLDYPGRRQYNGLCFAPGREPRNNYYNLWRGFRESYGIKDPVKAKKGLDMFLEHALENVCNGDRSLFNWLMSYFGHMIQKPFERPLTTLVFKGKKGTGKNALVDRVGFLLHKHYLVAHNARYLTSSFNGHMESCLMLVLDEAFWSGDKSAEGQLKGLTTAPEIMIEQKGRDPYKVDNLLRLVVIGNEEWLVPASADERRYAVFNVGDKRAQDTKFFHDMRVFMEEFGGSELLLEHLRNLKLEDINVAPKTEGLIEQKINSLEPLEEWIFDSLKQGCISETFVEEWPDRLGKKDSRDAFKKYVEERNIRSRIPSQIGFGMRLKRIMPSLDANQRISSEGKQFGAYIFPPLEKARKEFEKFLNQKIDWSSK